MTWTPLLQEYIPRSVIKTGSAFTFPTTTTKSTFDTEICSVTFQASHEKPRYHLLVYMCVLVVFSKVLRLSEKLIEKKR